MSDTVFKLIGAHSNSEREKDDYYSTDPEALAKLLEVEEFNPEVWECACGEGALSEVLIKFGYSVKSTDLIDRGYGIPKLDFLKYKGTWRGDIITNPPYKYATKFVQKSLEVISEGNKIAMFLRIQFLESLERYSGIYENNPPCKIYVATKRLSCYKRGVVGVKADAVCYAWFIWEKGYKGDPSIAWFNYNNKPSILNLL